MPGSTREMSADLLKQLGMLSLNTPDCVLSGGRFGYRKRARRLRSEGLDGSFTWAPAITSEIRLSLSPRPLLMTRPPVAEYTRRGVVLDQFETEAHQGSEVAEHGDALAIPFGQEVQTVQLVSQGAPAAFPAADSGVGPHFIGGYDLGWRLSPAAVPALLSHCPQQVSGLAGLLTQE